MRRLLRGRSRSCRGHRTATADLSRRLRRTRLYSLLRRRDRNQHGHDIVAPIDDLAAFVWPDEAGVVGPQHHLLAARNERELTRKHVVDLLRRRSVGSGSAAGQKMRQADSELLWPANIEPEQ